ncbi:MAG: nucleoside kinase [Clostridiales bacterium]|nr:nucleoside kinase [Clostridiales bacterium]
MKVTLNGYAGEFPHPMTVQELISQLDTARLNTALGASSGGTVLELTDTISHDIDMRTVDYGDEEGRRIYERSLRFVLLLAAERCFSDLSVRIEHSIGQGVYFELIGQRMMPDDAAMIEAEMRAIVEQDLPFEKQRWSRTKAIEYFEAKGKHDKSRLLQYRPYDHFDVYTAGGMAEYFYGAMLPSTGFVPVFALHSRPPGCVLLLPDRNNPLIPAKYTSLPKHMATFAQSTYWCKVLNCVNAADLNDLVADGGLRDFIRVNEALHDKSISDIADDIIRADARVIFIAGPSSSGKTTFANRLSIHLRVNGLRPEIISLDDFYRDRDSLPLEEDGQPDLEALSALDLPHFKTCIKSLLSGAETAMPRFDFTLKKRSSIPHTLRISPSQPLIIEGIHGLNPHLHESFDQRMLYRIYISELTCLNLDDHNRIRTTDARLLRRLVRDQQFRNTPTEKTLAMWGSVRRGEEKWVFPFQEQADTVFNSALHYELPVLKLISFDMLRKVPRSSPQFITCDRLLKILNYLLPAPESVLNEIPPLSILREFIGGNTLYLPAENVKFL